MRLDKPYSEETAQMIDEEVRKLVKKAELHTIETLTKHKADVEKVPFHPSSFSARVLNFSYTCEYFRLRFASWTKKNWTKMTWLSY